MTFQKEDLYKPNGDNEKVICQEHKDNELVCKLINFGTKKESDNLIQLS